MASGRYFVGYALKGEPKEWVESLKRRIAVSFGLGWSLRYPSHITIFHPFKIDSAVGLDGVLRKISRNHAAFTVSVLGFGHFDSDVWFIDVEQDGGLSSLKQRVVQAMADGFDIKDKDKGFSPHFHITLAHRELTPEIFIAIEGMLKEEKIPFRTLRIDGFSLFRETENGWIEDKSFAFGS